MYLIFNIIFNYKNIFLRYFLLKKHYKTLWIIFFGIFFFEILFCKIYIYLKLFKDYLLLYNSMTENNTNKYINEDIYNKFYSSLLVEIKKVIKRFQLRKAFRK